jgi:light-regulated signal transduction histidine kinase (bacteriophytochrome)
LLVSAAIRDLTDRQRVATALTLANRELEAFSYSVAHDLRAPLRGMNGFAQILLEDYKDKLDAAGQDCLQEIHQNAVRMGGLIDALLSLSRVTRSELRLEWLDLSAMARAVIAELAKSEPQRVVEVIVGDRLHALIDRALARTLMDNLIANAWKFTSKTSAAVIEFGSSEVQGTRSFFVRDNGVGFEMAYAIKLFAPFQRLHAAAEYPGTGVGLATVQRIVHRHGGRIWADGAVGQGATFYFNLPGRAPDGGPT